MSITTNTDTVNEIKRLLHEYASMLPVGSISKIADLSGFSQAYISRFFRGDYRLTHENEKILSIGIEIMEDMAREKEKQQNRQKEKISQKLMEAKSISINAPKEF